MAAYTHDGVLITVGMDLWLPVKCTAVNDQLVTAQSSYSGQSFTFAGPDTHQGKPPNFPDLP